MCVSAHGNIQHGSHSTKKLYSGSFNIINCGTLPPLYPVLQGLSTTYLAEGELLEEGISLVGFSEDEVLVNVDLSPAILGCHQHLEGPEVLGVGVQRLQPHPGS